MPALVLDLRVPPSPPMPALVLDLGVPPAYLDADNPRGMLLLSKDVEVPMDLTAEDTDTLAALFPDAERAVPLEWTVDAPLVLLPASGAADQVDCSSATVQELRTELQAVSTTNITVTSVECSSAAAEAAHRRQRRLAQEGASSPPPAAPSAEGCGLGPAGGPAATLKLTVRVPAAEPPANTSGISSSSNSSGTPPATSVEKQRQGPSQGQSMASAQLGDWTAFRSGYPAGPEASSTLSSSDSSGEAAIAASGRAAATSYVRMCSPAPEDTKVVTTTVRAYYRLPLSTLGASAYSDMCAGAAAASGLPSCEVLPVGPSSLQSGTNPASQLVPGAAPEPPAPAPSDSSAAGAIVASVVGAVGGAFIVAAAAAVFVVHRRKRARKRAWEQAPRPEAAGGGKDLQPSETNTASTFASGTAAAATAAALAAGAAAPARSGSTSPPRTMTSGTLVSASGPIGAVDGPLDGAAAGSSPRAAALLTSGRGSSGGLLGLRPSVRGRLRLSLSGAAVTPSEPDRAREAELEAAAALALTGQGLQQLAVHSGDALPPGDASPGASASSTPRGMSRWGSKRHAWDTDDAGAPWLLGRDGALPAAGGALPPRVSLPGGVACGSAPGSSTKPGGTRSSKRNRGPEEVQSFINPPASITAPGGVGGSAALLASLASPGGSVYRSHPPHAQHAHAATYSGGALPPMASPQRPLVASDLVISGSSLLGPTGSSSRKLMAVSPSTGAAGAAQRGSLALRSAPASPLLLAQLDSELDEPAPTRKPRPPTPPKSRRPRTPKTDGEVGKREGGEAAAAGPQGLPYGRRGPPRPSAGGEVEAGTAARAEAQLGADGGHGHDHGPVPDGDAELPAAAGDSTHSEAAGAAQYAVNRRLLDGQVLGGTRATTSDPGHVPRLARLAGQPGGGGAGGNPLHPGGRRVGAAGKYVRARTGREVATTRLADIMWQMYPRNERLTLKRAAEASHPSGSSRHDSSSFASEDSGSPSLGTPLGPGGLLPGARHTSPGTSRLMEGSGRSMSPLRPAIRIRGHIGPLGTSSSSSLGAAAHRASEPGGLRAARPSGLPGTGPACELEVLDVRLCEGGTGLQFRVRPAQRATVRHSHTGAAASALGPAPPVEPPVAASEGAPGEPPEVWVPLRQVVRCAGLRAFLAGARWRAFKGSAEYGRLAAAHREQLPRGVHFAPNLPPDSSDSDEEAEARASLQHPP